MLLKDGIVLMLESQMWSKASSPDNICQGQAFYVSRHETFTQGILVSSSRQLI